MSDLKSIARPYAKAAFEYALEHQQLREWHTFLSNAALTMASPEMQSLLKNSNITSDVIKSILIDVCDSSLDDSRYNFIELLASYKRLALFPEIVSLYKELVTQHDHAIDVDVFTVIPLTSEQQQALKKSLEEKLRRKIILHPAINKELMGGMLIRAGDLVIDSSIRHRLQLLTQELTD